jgi:hypothetical protein
VPVDVDYKASSRNTEYVILAHAYVLLPRGQVESRLAMGHHACGLDCIVQVLGLSDKI